MKKFAMQTVFATILVAMFLGPALSFSQTGALPSSTLGPGDVIRIGVFGQPDLSTLTRIDDNGNITFPLLGPVSRQGMSTVESERRIA